MKDQENVIERAAHVLYEQEPKRDCEGHYDCDRRYCVALHAAGLLVTQDHVDALKACEEYKRWHDRSGGAPVLLEPRAVYEVGQRSLAAKAAAQETPVERVKKAYKASMPIYAGKSAGTEPCYLVSPEVVAALNALVEEGE